MNAWPEGNYDLGTTLHGARVAEQDEERRRRVNRQ